MRRSNISVFHKYIIICVSALLFAAFPGCTNKVNYPVQKNETINSDLNLGTYSVVMPPEVYVEDDQNVEMPYIEKYGIEADIHGLYVMVTINMTIRNPNDRAIANCRSVRTTRDIVY